MKTPPEPTVTIDKNEYEVLRNIHQEWVRAAMVLAVFAFAVIGTSVPLFDFKSGNLAPSQVGWIKVGWVILTFSGILSGISNFVAFAWMDGISRRHMPSLVNKALGGIGPIWLLRLGKVGWIVTLSALFFLLLGLTCLMVALMFL